MEYVMSAIRRAERLQLMIFDVDGVLSDGGLYIGAAGELLKRFNSKDGLGITLLRRAGVRTAIITGRQSDITAHRAAELHIDELWQGCQDKRGAYQSLKEKYQLEDEQVGYIGDDLLDLPVMLQVGFAAAVQDAAFETRKAAHFVANARGGYGAVREIAEFVLKAQGKWDAVIAAYSDIQGGQGGRDSAQ